GAPVLALRAVATVSGAIAVLLALAVARAVMVVLHFHDVPNVVAERAVAAGRLPELHGELPEQVLFLEIAAGLRYLMAERFREREMLEQRHNVGERLVKRENIRIGGLAEPPVQSVEECVGRLVRQDVVRDRRENHAARQRAAGV